MKTRVCEYKFNTSCDTRWVLTEKKGVQEAFQFSKHQAAYDQTLIYIFIICASFWMIWECYLKL